MGLLARLRKAEREVTAAGSRVLLADADEKKKLKLRLVWLANTEKDKRAQRVYRNAYRSIKV